MRILPVTQYFWPESFKGIDIALELYKKGHQVTVLTGKPNYPSGKFNRGYSFWNRRTEEYNRIKIIRSPVFLYGKGTDTRLFLKYLL